MSSRLINVRLAAPDAARADALMAQGVELSQIVREAIRQEYNRRRVTRRKTADVKKILAKIYADNPAPDGAPPPFNKSADRQALRKHIVSRLRRKQS